MMLYPYQLSTNPNNLIHKNNKPKLSHKFLGIILVKVHKRHSSSRSPKQIIDIWYSKIRKPSKIRQAINNILCNQKVSSQSFFYRLKTMSRQMCKETDEINKLDKGIQMKKHENIEQKSIKICEICQIRKLQFGGQLYKYLQQGQNSHNHYYDHTDNYSQSQNTISPNNQLSNLQERIIKINTRVVSYLLIQLYDKTFRQSFEQIRNYQINSRF